MKAIVSLPVPPRSVVDSTVVALMSDSVGTAQDGRELELFVEVEGVSASTTKDCCQGGGIVAMNRAIEDEGVSTSSSRERPSPVTPPTMNLSTAAPPISVELVGTTTCGVVGTSTEIETNVGSLAECSVCHHQLRRRRLKRSVQ